MIKAYQGPNGWYTAEENGAGFHYQPMDGGHQTEAQARREAWVMNMDDEEDEENE